MLGFRSYRGLAAALAVGYIAAVAPAPQSRAANGFFSTVPDLPVMPGMTEIADAGVIFDKPEGRIVAMYAKGKLAPRAVLGFYADTLPQLGWRAAGDRSFRRDGELLRLEFIDHAGEVTVKFSLSPD